MAVGSFVKTSSDPGGTATYTFNSGLSTGTKYEVQVRWAPQSGTTYDDDALWKVYGNTSASPLTTLRVDLNRPPQGLPDASGFMWQSLGAVTGYTSGGTTSLTVKLTDDDSGTDGGKLVIDAVRLVLVGPVTTYTHDAAGNVATLTDPDGNTTAFDYNGLNQESTETNPLAASRSYAYYPTGELKQVIDRDGRVTKYQFDPVNRTTTEQWMSGSTVTRSIVDTYDALGRLTGVTDHDGSGNPLSADYSYSYDDAARTRTTTATIVGLSANVTLTESYNDLGQRDQLAATIGTSADFLDTFHYDSTGREDYVTQQNQSGGNAVAAKRAEFTYTGLGQFDTITRYANTAASNLVVTSQYSYDDAGRLTGLDHSQGTTHLATYGLTYDADHRLSTVTNSQYSGENVTYAYDNNAQLTGANYSTQSDESYAYDTNGNLYQGSIWTYSALRLLADQRRRPGNQHEQPTHRRNCGLRPIMATMPRGTALRGSMRSTATTCSTCGTTATG